MVRYRRNRVDGGTYFFTLALADRRATALVDHVVALRAAFRTTRSERPFSIDAIVILPDHLHAVLTLPPNDADFSARWRRIKGYFSSCLIKRASTPNAIKTVSLRFGSGDIGNTSSVTTTISPGMWTTFNTIPSNIAW
jgi:REP element-mobilizing transposase RayT